MSKILRAVEAAAESLRNRKWSDSLPLAVKLRNLRIDLEMSEEEFAEVYHMPLAQLQAWENGEDADSLKGKLWVGMIQLDPRGSEKHAARFPPEKT